MPRPCTLSAEGLLAILDDILDFSAIEADRLLLHETDFEPRAVIAEVSEIFAAKIDAKELSLRHGSSAGRADLAVR